jgi:hypothetical protein
MSTADLPTSEHATAYAALILADDGVDITSDNLQRLLKAAEVEYVEPIYITLFDKALKSKNIKNLLLNGGSAPAKLTRSSLPGFDETVGAYMLSYLGTNLAPLPNQVAVCPTIRTLAYDSLTWWYW